jgi:hypothetical protein
MNVSIKPGAIKKFRRTPWRFQETFQTPLKDLDRFVATILSADESIKQGVVVVDQYAFEPRNLKALIANPEQTLAHDWSVSAVGRDEVQKLLRTTLEDWIDFVFIPSPKPFVIYGDHDEYATFYANTKSNLNRITAILSEKGFIHIENWERRFRRIIHFPKSI